MKNILLLLLCCLSMPAFGRRHPRETPIPDVHRHVVTAHASFGGIEEFGAAYGLEYERFFKRNRRFSLIIPVDRYAAGTVGAAKSGQTQVHLEGYYAAPGLRYHPFKNDHLADPSVGVSLLMGYEKRSEFHYSSSIYYGGTSTRDEAFLGALLGQLGVNLHKYSVYRAKRVPVIGFFLTGGYIFSNTTPAEGYGNFKTHRYAQFGMRLGGHW